ncbi:MAG TPA: hypothetical protein VFV71_11940 [Burkholderiales bacterium]|nr:hypothetical protein [Burkholderiales bacterium]
MRIIMAEARHFADVWYGANDLHAPETTDFPRQGASRPAAAIRFCFGGACAAPLFSAARGRRAAPVH